MTPWQTRTSSYFSFHFQRIPFFIDCDIKCIFPLGVGATQQSFSRLITINSYHTLLFHLHGLSMFLLHFLPRNTKQRTHEKFRHEILENIKSFQVVYLKLKDKKKKQK